MLGLRGARPLLLAPLVALVLAGCGGGSAHSGSSAPATSAQVTVSGTPVGRPLPSGFLGFSIEYKNLETYAGANPSAINPAFVALLRGLSADGHSVLRIGGDSTDWTWWPVPGLVAPGGIRFSLTPTWAAVAKAVAQEAHTRLILGVNLEADSTEIARTEVQELLERIGEPPILAFEVGNEPELYGSFPWYKNALGQHVRGRPAGYGFSQYLSDFTQFAAALPGVPLAGPSTGAPHWLPLLGQFIAAEPRVGLVTVHRYPLKHCRATHVITDAELLSPSSTTGLADSVAGNVRAAQASHRLLRIDELNGVSCGGYRGVSDTFASALWVINALFALARTGVDGVNIHTVPGTINEIVGSAFTGGHWEEIVHPEFYGMLLFGRAAPAGSRLLSVSAGGSGTTVWAVQTPAHRINVVLVNSSGAGDTLTLKIPGARGAGVLTRLRAAGLTSTTGVTLGGQSFGAQTSTGTLAGPARDDTLAPRAGTYTVRVPAASAAMLSLAATG